MDKWQTSVIHKGRQTWVIILTELRGPVSTGWKELGVDMERLREFYGWLEAKLAYFKYEKGQTLIEYILILVVLVLAIIIAYESVELNNTISDTLNNMGTKLNSPN